MNELYNIDTQDINIDLVDSILDVVYCNQREEGSRTIRIHVYNKGKAFKIPATVTVNLIESKSNGHKLYYTVGDDDFGSFKDNIITIPITKEMTFSSGLQSCIIELLDNDKNVIYSTEFHLRVRKNSLFDQTIVDEDDYKAVVDLYNIVLGQKGKPNGLATLDENAKVPLEQLYDATTEDKGIVKLVDNFNEYGDIHTAATSNSVKYVYSELTDEVERAKEAEKTLDEAIISETKRAEGKEDELDKKIAKETEDRISAVSSEETARKNADNTLQTTIDNEVTRAEGAEKTLSDAITKEREDRIGAVSSEQAARENADNDLQTAIDNEVTRAKQAESDLDSKKANLASPTFTGTPKAPTASAGTNTTQIATTAFTQTAVGNHNTSTTAHTDIRGLISDLTNRLNALADSDDETLDQLSEIVEYIKTNRSLIESVTTSKVSVSDIVDVLTSTATNKPLSANQGKVLKGLIDTLQSSFDSHNHDDRYYTESEMNTKLNGKANTSHGTHVTYSTDAPKPDGTASAGSASTVARSDHVHPLQTSVSGNSGTATKLATARTIALTGSVTGSGKFDGSGDLSIATTTNHTHNYAGSSSAGGVANSSLLLSKNSSFLDGAVGRVSYYDAKIKNTTNDASWSAPANGWHQIYHNDLSVGGYWTELAFPVNDITGLAWRQRRNDNYYGWYRILDSNNYKTYCTPSNIGAASANHTHSYLPLSGGTMTGTIASSKTTNTYLDGNKGVAIINSTASAGAYTMLAKLNSTNGYFTQGVYKESYLLQYTSSSTVTAGTNSVTKSVTLLDESGNSKFPGTVTASGFSGNASSATKLATARTIALTGSVTGSGTFDGSGNLSIATSTNHTHNYAGSSSAGGDATQALKLKFNGNHTETASGTTANAPTSGMLYSSSMYMTGTYNDSATPCTYGNIINLSGAGSGQLACEWSGSDNVSGHLYYRSHRDTSTGGWGAWNTILDSSNYKTYCATSDHTHTSLTSTYSNTTVKLVVDKMFSAAFPSGGDLSLGKSDAPFDSLYLKGFLSCGRKSGTTVGANSFAFGEDVEASGDYSHAEGSNVIASGKYSHAEGSNTTASGLRAHAEGGYTEANSYQTHAEGYATIASGNASHAEGNGTKASGNQSHAEGYSTIASGTHSHAEGAHTTALTDQHAQGHYNNTTTATENSASGTDSGTAFVIGNGTSTSASNAFRVTGEGKIYATNSSIATGADYAEYFEWADENIDTEDRVGYFVTFDEENPKKIRIANEGDYILGVVSGMPSVIGNGDECWKQRYVLDNFGRYIEEEFEYEEEIPEIVEKEITDEETGETKIVEETVIHKEIKTGTKWKENPDYDNTKSYIPRSERPEWDAVGMVGVLSVYDDGTCQVNGYCKCIDGGIATSVKERGFDTYRVIKRVSDNIVEIVIK